jgi:hypothetical protein
MPSSPQKAHEMQVPSVDMGVFEEYLASKSDIGLAEREILAPVSIFIFRSPMYRGFLIVAEGADHTA